MRKMAILSIVLTLSGCGLFVPTLDQKGIVKVEEEGASPIRVINTVVYKASENETVVRGAVKYPIFIKYGKFDGHVDVEIITPEGTRLTNHNVKVVRRNPSQKMGREAFFVARFPIDPSPGSVVRVAYNDVNHAP